ncbi:MAG: hypothetical protein ACRCXZ_05965 [Patescibacteria group bacterium]
MFQIITLISDLKNYFGSNNPRIIPIKSAIKQKGVFVCFDPEQFRSKASINNILPRSRDSISGDCNKDPVPQFDKNKIQVVLISTLNELQKESEYEFVMFIPLGMFM